MVRSGVLCWGLALLMAAGACDGGGSPLPEGPSPVGPTMCPDSDNDNYQPIHCGGKDCNDNDPYINPAQLDGPWSFETRYIEDGDRIRAFTVDAQGTAHWLLRRATEDDTVFSLLRAEGPELSFGAPAPFDEDSDSDYDAQLRVDEEGTHVLFRRFSGGALSFLSSANDWQYEAIGSDVAAATSLLRHQGALALAFQQGAGQSAELFWATQQPDGSWSSSSILMGGHAHGAALSAAGEVHVIGVEQGSCFTDGQLNTDDSWTWTPFGEGQPCNVLAVSQDPQGHIYVLYHHLTMPQSTWLADNTGGQWQTSAVAPEWSRVGYVNAPYQADMVIDAGGTVHVMLAEQDERPAPMYYLQRSDSSWTHELVELSSSAAIEQTPDGEIVIGLTRSFFNGQFPQIAIGRRVGDDGIDQDCSDSL